MIPSQRVKTNNAVTVTPFYLAKENNNMAHWANSKIDEIENAVADTGWELTIPSSDDGPLICEHNDGSTLSFVNSSISGNFAIEYQDNDKVKAAVTDKHESWPILDNAVEWFIHIIQRHEKIN